MNEGNQRIVLHLDEAMTQRHSDGSHHYYPVLVKENESGYYRTDYDYGTDYKKARAVVDKSNAERGFSVEDVYKVIVSSMFGARK